MKGGQYGRRWVVMNEYIDSTMDHIHACLLCSLLVTIRGLVGPFKTVIFPPVHPQNQLTVSAIEPKYSGWEYGASPVVPDRMMQLRLVSSSSDYLAAP